METKTRAMRFHLNVKKQKVHNDVKKTKCQLSET